MANEDVTRRQSGNPRKRGQRMPRIMPQWLKRRVETDLYQLYDFSDEAAAYAQPGDLVLDAGAGEGRYKPDFKHAFYVGVDLAVGDVTWNYSDLDTIGDLEQLPFATGAFDVALCQQVLEHVREPEQVLREIARVLKPGGKLFLSVPQSWCQHQKPHDYFRYTSFGLRYLFEKVGLETEEIRPMGGYFWFLAFQLHNLNYWLFPKEMRGRIFTLPLRLVFGIIFQMAIPLFLYYLDPLDRQKDETFGHLCIAVKPPGQ